MNSQTETYRKRGLCITILSIPFLIILSPLMIVLALIFHFTGRLSNKKTIEQFNKASKLKKVEEYPKGSYTIPESSVFLQGFFSKLFMGMVPAFFKFHSKHFDFENNMHDTWVCNGFAFIPLGFYYSVFGFQALKDEKSTECELFMNVFIKSYKIVIRKHGEDFIAAEYLFGVPKAYFFLKPVDLKKHD